MWGIVLAVVLVLVSALLLYGRWRHQYWERKGVYSSGAVPLFGHVLPFITLRKFPWDLMESGYKKIRYLKIVGAYEFLKPSLTVMDLEILQRIFIKDFDHFVDRRMFKVPGKGNEAFNEMLTNMSGSDWKELRSVITPTFSSGKIKTMFFVVRDKSKLLIQHCKKETDNSAMELKEALSKYTMDVIGTCAFGLEVSALEGKNDKFTDAAKDMMNPPFRRSILQIFSIICSRFVELLNLDLSSPSLRYFTKVIENSIEERKKGHQKKDFLGLLLDASESTTDSNEKTISSPLSDKRILAQSMLFILAGFDTTATTLAFVVHYLAKYPQCQEILRKELKGRVDRNDDRELSYEDIMESKYLEAVVAETLRLNPPAFMLNRTCTKEYTIPGTQVVIPKGMIVNIPTYSIHRDENYFPDPEKFQPERFLPENKSSIPTGAYMPFGVGPRMCIAQRFALMETKSAIAALVLHFNMSLAEGFEELKFSKTFGIMRQETGTTMIVLKDLHQE